VSLGLEDIPTRFKNRGFLFLPRGLFVDADFSGITPFGLLEPVYFHAQQCLSFYVVDRPDFHDKLYRLFLFVE
jgi:hypothetical protein